MREILFKAKRKDNGKWIEGYYQKRYDLLGNEEHLIFHADSYKVWEYAEVDPETLCQFTGLTDKSNKRIWENDIVNHNGEYALVKFGMYCSSFDYGSYNLGFYVDFPEETFYRKELGYWRRKVETSGNVFDNPELLQEEH
jgi:hypothetical protein|nr:MAG TPA: YopX protein [Caudoviricetes sp.]